MSAYAWVVWAGRRHEGDSFVAYVEGDEVCDGFVAYHEAQLLWEQSSSKPKCSLTQRWVWGLAPAFTSGLLFTSTDTCFLAGNVVVCSRVRIGRV